MSGGIIIQRSSVLLKAINDPSFYHDLSDEDKNLVEVLNAKSPDQFTDDDVRFLSAKINELVSKP